MTNLGYIRNIFLFLLGTLLFAGCMGKPNPKIIKETGVKQANADEIKEEVSSKIEKFLEWSRGHKESYKEVAVDTFPYDDSGGVHLYFRKDKSLLLDKLFESQKAYHDCERKMNRSDDDDFRVYSFKRDEYISFHNSLVSYGFRRDHYFSYETYIDYYGKVYLVEMLCNQRVKDIIEKEILKFPKRDTENFSVSEAFDFCIYNGQLLIWPVHPVSDIEEEDEDGNPIEEYTGDYRIVIPYGKDLKFKLTPIDDIIKEKEYKAED